MKNLRKLVEMCGYKFPTNVQNFTKRLNQSNNIVISFRGYFILTHPVDLTKRDVI